MKPTIGRIVWYQSYGSPGGEYLSEPRAAIVTDRRLDAGGDWVRLAILNPSGLFFTELVRYDAAGAPGTWRWPPREPT